MTVDPAIVSERLRMIRELLDDLDQIGDVTAERLAKDRITRHAVERIVTQMVELSVSINSHFSASLRNEAPRTYRESFHAAAQAGAIPPDLAAELAPAAGLRNILTHEYAAVDLTLVAGAVPELRAAYRRYLAEVARFLASQSR